MRFTKYIIALTLTLFLGLGKLMAQAPSISSVDKVSGSVGEQVTIAGSGFGDNAANIQVWFGPVKANSADMEVSEHLIKVTIPTGATFDPIRITHLTTKLSAFSKDKFMVSYGGETFDNTKLSAATLFAPTFNRNLFDLCTCDLDGDGKPDIAVTKDDNADTDILVLKNNSTPGDLQFTSFQQAQMPSLQLNSPSSNISCGDLNGDGKVDLIISKGGTNSPNTVFVLRNTTVGSTISFVKDADVNLAASQVPRKIEIKDLDLDGRSDIIITNTFAQSNKIFIFKNTTTASSITFNPTPLELTPNDLTDSYGLEAIDLNNDGRPEIIVTPFLNKNIAVFQNNSIPGSISFLSNITISAGASSNIESIQSGDINFDGLPDLVITQLVQNLVSVLINQSTSSNISFKTPVSRSALTEPAGLDLADLNGDGKLDIVVTNQKDSRLTTFINTTASSTSAVSFDVKHIDKPTNPSWSVISNDFDGDGKPDIAYTSFNKTTNNYRVGIIRNGNCYKPTITTDAGSLLLCSGQTKRLETHKGIGITFVWRRQGETDPIKTGTDHFVDVSQGGTYTVTAISENNACQVTSDGLVLSTVGDAGPPASTASTGGSVCEGDDLQLLASTVNGVGYLWTGPNGYTSEEQNPIIANITAEQSGVYTVRTKVADCIGQPTETTAEVIFLPEFYIATDDQLLQCNGGEATLRVTEYAGFDYQWLKDGSEISGAINTTLVVNSQGDYTVEVSNSGNAITCSKTTDVTRVDILPELVAAISADSEVCVQTALSFESTTVVDQTTPVSYSWNFGDSQTSTDKDPTHTYTTAGDFTVTLTVTYTEAGCTDNEMLLVTVVDVPTVEITASSLSICPNDEVGILLSIAGDYASIAWSNTDPVVSTNSYKIYNAGSYGVTVTNANGCEASDEITIAQFSVPNITILTDPNPPIITAGETIRLIAEVSIGSISDYQWSWTPAATLTTPNAAETEAYPLDSITYTVEAISGDDCSVFENIKILVEIGENVFGAKAFSPNGDGQNDTWQVLGKELYADCTLTIYDKNGRKVYQQLGYNNDWDGTNNGKELNPGVYYYVMNCPDKKPSTGNILLVR